MSSSSIRPRASMSASVTYEWLWCDDHVKITQWFLTQPRLTYKQFYASFINFANRVWELSRQQERAPLEGLEKFIVELLQKERISADGLLTALQEYSAGLGEGKARWKENGLVAFSEGLSKLSIFACPLRPSPQNTPHALFHRTSPTPVVQVSCNLYLFRRRIASL
ncbi:unnamed protein product [Aureobasidium mustum]|uniref:Uncharacterized protein n=1 Tax=Aureobasidium mustum TaxID=2773714 RepID=A0A9N8JZL4_9PEZI|nr:unnamed protein product [Aureobasidium mustum]